MVSKQDVIKEIKVQLESSHGEDMNTAVWENCVGVLLTGNQAKKVLEVLER